MKALKRFKTITSLGALAIGLTFNATAFAQDLPSQAEMWQMIQAQQKQIAELRALVEANQGEVTEAKVEASTARSEVAQTKAQLDATTLAIESIGESSGSSGTGWWEKTSVGGYGELHANFFSNAPDEIDFHRFVLFVNHQYNDWITLYTELEVEHAYSGNGKPGAVELEQAFVRLDWTDKFSTDAGLFLMPIGQLNEIHEPNTFYGVERNSIENKIIPTTWWEAGVRGIYRFENGVSVDFGLSSGLDTGPNAVIRNGRQKVAKAINDEAAVFGRIKYTGIPGLEVAVSGFFQNDLAQDDPVDISARLLAANLDYERNGFGFKALYARWDLDGTLNPAAETQKGFYLEPSYRFQLSEHYGDLGVYFRYSDYDFFTGTVLSENEILEIGLNYWPTDNVVLKADVQDFSKSDEKAGKGDTAINLGVGYQF